MDTNLKKGKVQREQEYEIPEISGGNLELDERSYYERTEAVHQFHMRKQ